MGEIRACRNDEHGVILAIVNEAADAYRGVIPPDRWHEPYMGSGELQDEIDAGVAFWGYELEGTLLGVMGIQRVRDVDLIRHAYVRPASQRHGVGGALLEHLRSRSTRRILVGTWAAAEWAVRLYRRHGFEPVSREQTVALLKDVLDGAGRSDRDVGRVGQSAASDDARLGRSAMRLDARQRRGVLEDAHVFESAMARRSD